MLRDGKVLVARAKRRTGVRPGQRDLDRHREDDRPRHSHGAATLLSDGKVLVAGGFATVTTAGLLVDSAEVYDPDTGSWTAIANMHAETRAEAATLQPDGKVLVVGSAATYVRGGLRPDHRNLDRTR